MTDVKPVFIADQFDLVEYKLNTTGSNAGSNRFGYQFALVASLRLTEEFRCRSL